MAGFGSGVPGGRAAGVGFFRHGGYSFLRTGNTGPCKQCAIGKAGQCQSYDEKAEDCAVALEAMDDMVKKIVALPWIRPEDMPLIELYVRNWIFLFIVDKWLSITGPFRIDVTEGLSAKGILKQRWVAENSLSRLANQLGLSPESRKSLGISMSDEGGPDFTAAEEKFRTRQVETKSVEAKSAEQNGA